MIGQWSELVDGDRVAWQREKKTYALVIDDLDDDGDAVLVLALGEEHDAADQKKLLHLAQHRNIKQLLLLLRHLRWLLARRAVGGDRSAGRRVVGFDELSVLLTDLCEQDGPIRAGALGLVPATTTRHDAYWFA